MEKRYQYFGRNGIEWTEWFKYDSNYFPKYQFGKKLINEYRN